VELLGTIVGIDLEHEIVVSDVAARGVDRFKGEACTVTETGYDCPTVRDVSSAHTASSKGSLRTISNKIEKMVFSRRHDHLRRILGFQNVESDILVDLPSLLLERCGTGRCNDLSIDHSSSVSNITCVVACRRYSERDR
jgi:hypothetical protein